MKKQWDLTDTEIEELVVREEHRMGRGELLAALQRQLGMEAKAGAAWWEAFVLSHKIPKEFRYRLVVDHRLGKAWVKGEVEKLDNSQCAQQDNPYG